ncbi:MAG: hypothetical protein A2096_15680, partial [Spirochaetes bacterium GWF1_41_5]
LLSSADLLRSMINNPETSNNADISRELVSLKGAATVKLDRNEKAALKKNISIPLEKSTSGLQLTELDLIEAKKGGKFLYLLEYDLIRDIEARGISTDQFIKKLESAGRILQSKIETDEIPSLENAAQAKTLPFHAVYATVLDPEMMQGIIEVDPAQITLLTDEIIKMMTAKDGSTVQSEEKKSQPVIAEPLKTTAGKNPETLPGQIAIPRDDKSSETSLRVHVNLLDKLMTLAGELVLARNQLVQSVNFWNRQDIEKTSQRLNMITSEFQEAVMATRMQPLGNVFNKFKRLVRDLAKNIGKEIDLDITGEDVELDKTIIETITDPLTHIIRNSIDHGIESPEERQKNGKTPAGHISISAHHEAGQVIICVKDDGQGINPVKIRETALKKGMYDKKSLDEMNTKELIELIYKPGFSTAEKITDVSGRGVGMDVVNTNITKIGGVIDIESDVGRGTALTIKLPLTLAIIPSLLLMCDEQRYAIPQVNLLELVRIPAAQVKERIEKIDSSLVIRLRGELLPLVRLSEILHGGPGIYIDPESEEKKSERRISIADRRTLSDVNRNTEKKARGSSDRRVNFESAVNIVVVNAGNAQYGIIVNRLLDSEEIVVKPIGTHLRACKSYFSGATILGDGTVSLILDVIGISSRLNMTAAHHKAKKLNVIKKAEEKKDSQSLLIVNNAVDEQFAIPLSMISRIETVKKSNIETTAGRKDIKYRGGSLLLHSIEDTARVKPIAQSDDLFIIVFPFKGREAGLLISNIVDVIDTSPDIDTYTFNQPGVLGSAIILEKTTLFIDLYAIAGGTTGPQPVKTRPELHEPEKLKTSSAPAVLIVEDSPFFLNNMRSFIEDSGYKVITATDGVQGLEALNTHAAGISIIVTDIEMPNMNGLEMTRAIRRDPRFVSIPIIAVTSVAGEKAEREGLEAGITEYQIKLDREKILSSLKNYCQAVIA